MIFYLSLPIFTLLTPYLTWVLFLAAMNLIRAKNAGTLSRTALFLGWPLVIVGYALDILVNFFFLSIITFDFPREWTTTSHLKKLCLYGGWRCTVATWVCHNLLDTFDPSGHHC